MPRATQIGRGHDHETEQFSQASPHVVSPAEKPASAGGPDDNLRTRAARRGLPPAQPRPGRILPPLHRADHGYVRERGETPPSCSGFVPFTEHPYGLAVDPDPLKGNLFVGRDQGLGRGGSVDEFSSSGAFLENVTGVPGNGLAFDDQSGQLAGAGAGEFVAVDNSLKLPEEYGDVYFTSPRTGSKAARVRQIERRWGIGSLHLCGGIRERQ